MRKRDRVCRDEALGLFPIPHTQTITSTTWAVRRVQAGINTISCGVLKFLKSIGTECAAVLSEMHFVLVQHCVEILSVEQLKYLAWKCNTSLNAAVCVCRSHLVERWSHAVMLWFSISCSLCPPWFNNELWWWQLSFSPVRYLCVYVYQSYV